VVDKPFLQKEVINVCNKIETQTQKAQGNLLPDVFRRQRGDTHGRFQPVESKSPSHEKNKNGMWEKMTFLFPGTYEYRFMVDGQWKNDPENNQTLANRFGTKNNFIVVPST
jgi:hypothetical protein